MSKPHKESPLRMRPMGEFVRKSVKPPSATELALSMREIGKRSTALLVEVDGLISEVEDYVLAHSTQWTQENPRGQVWRGNLDQLLEWRDTIQEIGEDSLTWE